MSLANRLSGLLKQHEPKLLRDQRALFAFMEAGKWPEREHFLMKAAYRAGVVERLLRSGDEAIQRQAYNILANEFALSPDAAEETVRALSLALSHQPPPPLAPPPLARPVRFKLPSLPLLFTARLGKRVSRLAVALLVLALLGLGLGWLLARLDDTPSARELRQEIQFAEQQQSTMLQQIEQAKNNADIQRTRMQNELNQLKADLDKLSNTPRQAPDVPTMPLSDNKNAKSLTEKPSPPLQANKACPNCPELVALPGGEFMMGSDNGDHNEKPIHKVSVKPFKMGKYEVTQAQYQAVMGSNPSNFKNCGGDCPVEQVSFNDVQYYINKLNQQTGKHFRLPTEAEWEYACRGGKQQTSCGSDTVDDVAWYGDNSGNTTHTVGKKQGNGFGLYDLSGNVWEWTCSADAESYNGNEKSCANDYTAIRVIRGGAWLYNPDSLRSAYRLRFYPVYRNYDLGFRLAQD